MHRLPTCSKKFVKVSEKICFMLFILITFLLISPNCKYRSGFLSGLCIPDFEHFRRDFTKGSISSSCVLGIVNMGGASLFIGFTISMIDLVVVGLPSTKFVTACTCDDDDEPSAMGSNDAHVGIEEKRLKVLVKALEVIFCLIVRLIDIKLVEIEANDERRRE
jgi:hypothetical protein